ncbi:MAG TPA: DUF86 domain-containing protein [Thermoanaerobaculia bacterium]|nr:DUF86 domain-containing protein [Thermoanaerobaculia bacterium]
MWRDDAYFLDILIAARKVLQYTEGISWEGFKEDILLQDAVMRNLQIVGEAARKVSDESRAAHSGIPWAEIIGMRNRLVHEYFRIDVEKVWETARDDIPTLVRLIEPLVPPEDQV